MRVPCLSLCLVQLLELSCGQDDASSLNGGSVLAMAGAECIALAVDKRFGLGSQVGRIIAFYHSHNG
jgi:hypothetical protein